MSPYIKDIVLGQESKNKFAYFFKIEEIQLSFFISLIQRFKIKNFLDIGANVGFYSLIVSKLTDVERIIAFEPTPLTFDELKLNTESNSSFPIKIKNIGLSDEIGSICFSDFGNMSGKNGIVDSSIHDTLSAHKITINTNKLDHLFNDENELYALKIDTEGHELHVIKGGKAFLSRNKCIIQIEMGGYNNNANEIKNFLKSLEYTQIIKLGPDCYFSNIEGLLEPETQYDLLQTSLNFVIDSRWM